MSIEQSLENLKLSGRKINFQEQKQLEQKLGLAQDHWLVNLMRSYPLAGAAFSLSEEFDESKIGVEMQWLEPTEILSEAFEAYPGISALQAGYVPIGKCLLGSGDPYFVLLSPVAISNDPSLFRIPHEAIQINGQLALTAIELVKLYLSQFFATAEVY